MTEVSLLTCTIAGLKVCARAGMQTPAMLALNAHVIGTHTTVGVGYEAAADALLAAGFSPPADPKWFSASLACNLLGLPMPESTT